MTASVSRSPTSSPPSPATAPRADPVIVPYLGQAAEVAARVPRGARSRVHRAFRGQGADLQAAALQPTALHPLLLGHDGRAEMHRAWRRRHAAPARQGASPAIRHPRRRPHVLFHHLRLDDVELARLRPRREATLLLFDGSPFAPEPCCSISRRRAHHAVRHLGEIYRRLQEGRACARRGRMICRPSG